MKQVFTFKKQDAIFYLLSRSMKNYFVKGCILLFSLFSFVLHAQNETTISQKKKGKLYVSFGYNKDWFTKSDIHFENHSNAFNSVTGNHDYYDFTIYNAKAKDRPGFADILKTDLSIPQYAYRVGYYFGNKSNTGIEISFDHVKYVVIDDQQVRVKGNILGENIDKDTTLLNWLHFEHTNGANFLMLNFLKRYDWYKNSSGKFSLSFIIKPGAGIVIPRTDVTIFGQRLNNRFHIAGYVFGIETGLRGEFFKYGFFESTIKGTFANYTNVLVIGDGKANHHFGTFEVILTAGIQFPF